MRRGSGITGAPPAACLAYLLLHDPEYRRVRKEHLIEVGKRIRLKRNIGLLSQLLRNLDGYSFGFYVISAAPEEVIQSALEGIVPTEHTNGTQFRYDPSSGEIESIIRVPAGHGKVAVLEELESKLQIWRAHSFAAGCGCERYRGCCCRVFVVAAAHGRNE